MAKMTQLSIVTERTPYWFVKMLVLKTVLTMECPECKRPAVMPFPATGTKTECVNGCGCWEVDPRRWRWHSATEGDMIPLLEYMEGTTAAGWAQ